MAHPDRRLARLAEVRWFVDDVYGADLHAKRVNSLCEATLGVLQAASLAVAMIGQALAQARSLAQACHQAGRPVALQPSHQRRRYSGPLGATSSAHGTPSWWPWIGPTSTDTSHTDHLSTSLKDNGMLLGIRC